MATLIVRGIGRLLTMAGPPVADAAVAIEDGRVAWTGPERELRYDGEELDAGGACVVPGFVDAHTHLVWAGVRREEFAARMRGERYDGGGIRVTVAATRATPTEELARLAGERAREALRNGTTTIEVKTGYGLDAGEELRLLDAIAAIDTPQHVEPTYLAHLPGAEHPLEEAAARGARWFDVFCDRGAFSLDESRALLRRARDSGLGLRIHAEQLGLTGGASLAAEEGCASADHLDHVDAAGARALRASGTVAVLLPTATLSTRGTTWDAAKVLREEGVPLALGTDCNPGTSWCESMPYAIQLACLLLGLSVEEAFRAATLGAARSLRLDDAGHLAVGARGDLAILDAEHEADLVAHLGARPVAATVVAGNVESPRAGGPGALEVGRN